MKTKTTSAIVKIAAAIIAQIGVAAMPTQVHAHGAQYSGTGSGPEAPVGRWAFVNPAYTHAIPGGPNPAPMIVSKEDRALYVDKAYGQAIYSYETRDREMTGGAAGGDADQ